MACGQQRRGGVGGGPSRFRGCRWHTVANIAYFAPDAARGFLADLLLSVDVAPCSTRHALEALAFPMAHLEDALQAAAALACGADRIVTRNVTDFLGSPMPAVAPAAFAARLTMGS